MGVTLVKVSGRSGGHKLNVGRNLLGVGMDHWANAALLLVGHGSSRLPAGHEATARLAAAIRERGLFAEVRECFCKEPPFLSLDLVRAPLIYVVPNFAGEGVYTRRIIPERLGLSGPVAEIGGRRVIYCDPVGSHPGMPGLLRRRAEELCAANKVAPTETALLVVAHGSQSGRASRTAEAVATAVRDSEVFAEVINAYIEQEPRVADWPRLVRTASVIAAPLLVSEGMHTNEDLPPLFGLSAAVGGPVTVAGHRVWLMGGIGRDPEVVEMILGQVQAADARLSLAT